jgi:hypothetical protein
VLPLSHAAVGATAQQRAPQGPQAHLESPTLPQYSVVGSEGDGPWRSNTVTAVEPDLRVSGLYSSMMAASQRWVKSSNQSHGSS